LFEAGDAALIGNVGPLIEPLDVTAFEANSTPVPARLFSHNDQQSTWMSFAPEGAAFGWGGRFGDAALQSNANQEPVFTAMSLAGNAVLLSGELVQPYQIGTEGVQEIIAIDQDALPLSPAFSTILRQHFETAGPQRANLFERDFVNASVVSLGANDLFNSSLTDAPPPLTTDFPQTALGQQLRAVADTINVRNALEARRQIFFVALGEFDTHSDQATTLPRLQREVSDAIASFYAATQELGLASDVTLFTASDFGRTLIINGDGTDHGWGGHHFAVGGAVNGRTIYGDIPIADVGHPLDAGSGRLIPSVSVEQYAAAFGGWFGNLGLDEPA
ncbi:MAG: DUF1501 domain-containing protein, partial [Pseudomonadota bacterium]